MFEFEKADTVAGMLTCEEFEEELRKDPIRFQDSELDFLFNDQPEDKADDET